VVDDTVPGVLSSGTGVSEDGGKDTDDSVLGCYLVGDDDLMSSDSVEQALMRAGGYISDRV
jgi:hypothetical protein